MSDLRKWDGNTYIILLSVVNLWLKQGKLWCLPFHHSHGAFLFNCFTIDVFPHLPLSRRTDHCSNPVMTATSSNGHIANSNGHIANSNGHIGNSNGHIANSNGHIAVHQTAIPMYSRQCSSGYASSTLNSQGSLNEMTTPNSATLFIPASQATNPWLFPGVYAPNTTMEYPQPPPSGGVAASVASLGPIAVLQNPFYNSQENEDDTCMMDNPVYMDKMVRIPPQLHAPWDIVEGCKGRRKWYM